MPGPMSAPAGNKKGVANTFSPRDPNKRIHTGKTEKQRAKGKISAAKNRRSRNDD